MALLDENVKNIKIALLASNIVFLITGFILIVNSVKISHTVNDYNFFLMGKFDFIPTTFIAIGAFAVILSIYGFFTAIKINYKHVFMFSGLLIIIAFFDLVVALISFATEMSVRNIVSKNLEVSIAEYNPSTPDENTVLWDKVQREFACCGIQSFTDWAPMFFIYAPLSCCRIPNGALGTFTCEILTENPYLYQQGCQENFSVYIMSLLSSLSSLGISTAIIQLFDALFVLYVAFRIKSRTENPEL